MERSQVIDNIRQVAASVLPKGSTLYLYGSRARGDDHEDSGWATKRNVCTFTFFTMGMRPNTGWNHRWNWPRMPTLTEN